MQPIRQLENTLSALADGEHYLFSASDLKCALPQQSHGAFKALLGRSEKVGILQRVCHGIYIYPTASYPRGMVLYHTAARLRANTFSYLSLETVLSDAGIISQLPMNWITLMSSGRSNIVNCGGFGHIEFIHTKKRPKDLVDQLSYDANCRLWRASVNLALKDMLVTRRRTDLVQMGDENESV